MKLARLFIVVTSDGEHWTAQVLRQKILHCHCSLSLGRHVRYCVRPEMLIALVLFFVPLLPLLSLSSLVDV